MRLTKEGLWGRLRKFYSEFPSLGLAIDKKETRNGMLETRAAYERAGLKFGEHAVTVPGVGRELDRLANNVGWLKRLPKWVWVRGKTSELSTI